MLAPILSAVDSPWQLAPPLGIKHRARGEVSSWKSSLSPALAWTRPVQILSSSLNPLLCLGIWMALIGQPPGHVTASDPVMWLRGFSMKKSQFWVLCSSPKDCKSHVKPNPQRGRKSRRLMPRRQVISVKYGWARFSTKRAPMSLVKGKGSLLLSGPESGRNFRWPTVWNSQWGPRRGDWNMN